ncbi:3939_t:CDS:2, partial [Racocetra fulgida]
HFFETSTALILIPHEIEYDKEKTDDNDDDKIKYDDKEILEDVQFVSKLGLNSEETVEKEVLERHCDNLERSNINENLDDQFTTYRAMREAYKNNIQMAKKSDRSAFHVLSFDFAQNIELPHDPQQPERWYYSSLLKDEFQLFKPNTNTRSLNSQELVPKGLLEEKQGWKSEK